MRLQRIADEALPWVEATPGAANMGRLLGCDDVGAFGWDAVFEILARDSAFAFRMMPAAAVGDLADRMAARGYRLDSWDVFSGARGTVAAAARAVLAAGLPPGFAFLPLTAEPDSPAMQAYQDFLIGNGIVPFSGTMLAGPHGAGVSIGGADGVPVATGYAYLPHNRFSPYHRWAWVGLVAVAPDQRGRNLGRAITARAIAAAVETLEADAVYALASETNLASRRMIEACGLRHDPTVKTCLAVPAGTARFTR